MLVGHAGGIRGRHYVDPASRFDAMRAAGALIPDVDWRSEPASNVISFGREGRATRESLRAAALKDDHHAITAPAAPTPKARSAACQRDRDA
jgi:hypothetical protein